MKQKVLSLILALILSVNVLPMSAMAETSENIQKTAFTDVNQNDWFFENVNTAVDLGLMVGVGDGKFAPSDEVTLAMAVTMASRVHSIYEKDGEKFENTGDTWYQPYVDYAKENGIIADAMDWEAEATRVAIAQMFARSLPEKALSAINPVDDGMIPDVKSDLAVYTLYRAGVFVGSDEKGSFHPDTAITRAEISAVVSRMLDEDLRATITLKAEETKKPITGGGSSSGGSSSKPAEEIKPEEVIGENNELKVPFDQAFPEAMESEDIKYDDKTLMIKFKKSFDGTVTSELSNAGIAKLEHMMDLEDAVWYTAYIKDGDEVETVLENVRKLSNVIVTYLKVAGQLLCQGTQDNHIVIKPSELMREYRVQIYESGSGYVSLEYTDITNPHLYANDNATHTGSSSSGYEGITKAYGCEFSQNYSGNLYYRYLSGGKVYTQTEYSNYSGMKIENAEACRYYNMGGGRYGYYMYGNYDNCLFADSNITNNANNTLGAGIVFKNCVFYGNTSINNGVYDKVSSLALKSNLKPSTSWINKVVRDAETGITYIYMSTNKEEIAEIIGATLVSIDNDAEKDFLYENFGKYSAYSNYDYLYEISSSNIDDISLDSYAVTIDMENSFQIVATVEPTGANAEDLVYTTDESGIVEVSEDGLIKGLQVGNAEVYVSSPDGYVTAIVNVTVKETTPLEAITLSDDELYLDVGDTWYTAPVLTPADTSMTRLTFTSSDENVATVDNMGVITAVGVGDAQITATGINGVSTMLDLRVGISPESISFDSKYFMTGLDTTELPEVIFVPENATETDLAWKTADSSIAEVIDGQLVCNGIGTTILRATTQNGKSADVYISVSEETLNSPVVEFEAPRYFANYNSRPSYYFLCENGTVLGWKSNEFPKLLKVDGEILTGVTDIATGNGNLYIYIKGCDGNIDAYSIGDNGNLTLIYDDLITDAKKIAGTTSSSSGTYCLKNDGTVWYMKGSAASNISNNRQIDTAGIGTIVDMVAGYNDYIYLLNDNGEVWYKRHSNSTENDFTLLESGVVSIQNMNGDYAVTFYTEDKVISYYENNSVNSRHEYSLKGDKDFAIHLYSTSSYAVGQYYIIDGIVYDGNDNPIEGIENADNIFFNGSESMYISTTDGKLYGIGSNDSYQMTKIVANGTYTTPQLIPFGFDVSEDVPELISENLNDENILTDDAICIAFSDVVTKNTKYSEITLAENGEVVSVNKKFDMNKFYIKPVMDGFLSGVEYTLTIPASAFASLNTTSNGAYSITFTVAEGELNAVYPSGNSYEKPQSPVLPEAPADGVVIDETVERFEWTAESIIAKCEEARPTGIFSVFTGNAILNRLYDDNVEYWLRPTAPESGGYTEIDLGGNWWGTTDKFLIGKQILDYDDYQTLGDILEDNILTAAPENVWPFVTEAYLENAEGERVESIGNEAVTFVLKFNRDMNTDIPLTLAFGSTYPFADYEVEGEYVDARTWRGSTTLTTLIENGTQYLNIKGAIGDDGREIPWDRGRFVFNIDTTSALAMSLQGEADDNGIKLTWWQDDFDTLAGYNVYRSESEDGFYQKLNSTILTEKEFYDDTVEPGKVYYYNFTVVKTDLSESTPSGKAVIRAKDTMSPTMYHTPIYTAYTGSNLVVNATVTDNVAVDSVTLYYRTVGEAEWKSLAMTNLNDKYSAVINANNITTAGLEYYIDAFDGVTHAYRGTEAEPYVVTVKLAVSNNAKGDVDGDGKIKLLDALLILQAINDRYNMTEEQFLRADLDDSGELNAWEALKVMQYSNGKISSVLPDTEE